MKLRLTAVLLFALTSATTATTPTHVSAQALKRRVVDGLQAPVFLISPSSDELGQPSIISLSDRTVDIFDYADRKVRRISRSDGKVLQRFGGAGGGPGEFDNLTSMG